MRAQETTTPGIGIGQAIAFVAGALAAFAALALFSSRGRGPDEVTTPPSGLDPRHPIFAAGVHVVAIGVALAAGMLSASLLGGIAWFITPSTTPPRAGCEPSRGGGTAPRSSPSTTTQSLLARARSLIPNRPQRREAG